jgi:G3E family GTPase
MDERTVTELMIDQLEFANVILVNKIDLASKNVKDQVFAMCRKLNKDAKIFFT